MQQAEVIKRLEHPLNNGAITRGIMHGERLRFHSDVILSLSDTVGGYLPAFKKWVNELLPEDKYDRFLQLLTFPLPTNELVDSIYKNLARVFEGENKVVDISLKDETKAEAFEETFCHEDFIKKAFRAIKANIDTVIVCDAPAEQNGTTPEPYYYFVDISNVIDISVTDDEITFIAYKNGEIVVVLDDEFVRTYSHIDGKYRLLTETANMLKKVPARMLWSDKLRTDNDINAKSPLTPVLGKLDKLLFDMVSRDYAEMYGKYPILVSYEIATDYSTGKKDATNKGKGNHLLGAGSNIENPAPTGKDEPDLNLNAVRFVNADPAVLKFIDDRIKSDADGIFTSVVGTGGEPVNDQAKNQKQIQAGFESKLDVLTKLKYNFEEAEEWLVETLAEMQFGAEFGSCEIDYGTEFYLVTSNEILTDICESKSKGAPDGVVMDMTQRYFNAKYKTDEDSRKRAEILRDLDPFPSSTTKEIFELYKLNPALVGVDKMYLKVHFEELVQRFERENVPLVNFGTVYDYREKIQVITAKLLQYVTENNDTSKQETQLPNPAE